MNNIILEDHQNMKINGNYAYEYMWRYKSYSLYKHFAGNWHYVSSTFERKKALDWIKDIKTNWIKEV
jgi:hypothetical protein